MEQKKQQHTSTSTNKHNETSDRNCVFHAVRCDFSFFFSRLAQLSCYQHVGRIEPVLCMRFILYIYQCVMFLLNIC